MNKETIELLREAFGQLGVGVEYAMGELASYYWAMAWVNVVLLVVVAPLVLSVWGRVAIRQARAEVVRIEADTGYHSREWEAHVIWNIGAWVVAVLTWVCMGLGLLPTSIAALVSPNGYVLSKLIGAL